MKKALARRVNEDFGGTAQGHAPLLKEVVAPPPPAAPPALAPPPPVPASNGAGAELAAHGAAAPQTAQATPHPRPSPPRQHASEAQRLRAQWAELKAEFEAAASSAALEAVVSRMATFASALQGDVVARSWLSGRKLAGMARTKRRMGGGLWTKRVAALFKPVVASVKALNRPRAPTPGASAARRPRASGSKSADRDEFRQSAKRQRLLGSPRGALHDAPEQQGPLWSRLGPTTIVRGPSRNPVCDAAYVATVMAKALPQRAVIDPAAMGASHCSALVSQASSHLLCSRYTCQLR